MNEEEREVTEEIATASDHDLGDTYAAQIPCRPDLG
jgi:hypothetical protein